MKRALKIGVVYALVAVAPSSTVGAQDAGARLDSLITAEMEQQRFPGIAAAAVADGRTVWIGTYGLADVANNLPVTAGTPFQLASVSKPLNATVLLTLGVGGRFDLDDDIDRYLPFEVTNPAHPDAPITFRQLLRHRSSIADNMGYYRPFWRGGTGDPTVGLGQYLEEYLLETGANFDPARNFHPVAPGAEKHYCNTCYALLGYLAEAISGTPFERLSEEILFEPLEMTATGWFLRDLEGPTPPAVPHRFAPDTGYVALGHNGYPDWPAGQLRSSIEDVARFLATYAAGGVLEDQDLIDPRVIDVMAPESADLGFHTWFQTGLPNGQVLYSHGGGDAGVNTILAFHRPTTRGVVVLANGSGSVHPIAEAVFLAIEELAEAGRDDGR